MIQSSVHCELPGCHRWAPHDPEEEDTLPDGWVGVALSSQDQHYCSRQHAAEHLARSTVAASWPTVAEWGEALLSRNPRTAERLSRLEEDVRDLHDYVVKFGSAPESTTATQRSSSVTQPKALYLVTAGFEVAAAGPGEAVDKVPWPTGWVGRALSKRASYAGPLDDQDAAARLWDRLTVPRPTAV